VKRRTCLAAACLVVLGACSHAKSAARPGAASQYGTGDTAGSSPTTAASSGHTNLGAGTPTTSGNHSTRTTSPSQRTHTSTPGTSPTDTGAAGNVGAYARTLLRPAPATSIVIEVFQQSGAEPGQNTLDHAASVWQQNADKPVSVGGPLAVAGGAQDWTPDQIRALADQQTHTPQTETRAVVHLLYLHGTFQGDNSILGISVRGDTAAVFQDQVRSSASPIARRAVIEDAVTEHELGHILGLVDLVLHTGRGDPKHPGHSTDTHSVMYWAIESDVVSQVLGGPPPVDFDDADRADLATIRNGG
jgi:hypothetical protein